MNHVFLGCFFIFTFVACSACNEKVEEEVLEKVVIEIAEEAVKYETGIDLSQEL